MTKDCKEVFTDIYARKVWGDGSGGGSAPDVARPYIDFVSEYLSDKIGPYGMPYNSPIESVLDIGSGDGCILKLISWNRAHCIGLDTAHIPAPDPTPRVQFCNDVDVIEQQIGHADLVLCKEVLQHLSNEQIQLLLDRTAHYPRRLFTNTMHPDLPVNTDIETGDTRAVDLTLAPFNQPAKTVFTYGHWIVQELTNP